MKRDDIRPGDVLEHTSSGETVRVLSVDRQGMFRVVFTDCGMFGLAKAKDLEPLDDRRS